MNKTPIDKARNFINDDTWINKALIELDKELARIDKELAIKQSNSPIFRIINLIKKGLKWIVIKQRT